MEQIKIAVSVSRSGVHDPRRRKLPFSGKNDTAFSVFAGVRNIELNPRKGHVARFHAGKIVAGSLIRPAAFAVIGGVVAESHVRRGRDGNRNALQRLFLNRKLQSDTLPVFRQFRDYADGIQRFLAPHPRIHDPDTERPGKRKPGISGDQRQRRLSFMQKRGINNPFRLLSAQREQLAADLNVHGNRNRKFDLHSCGIGFSVKRNFRGITPAVIAGFLQTGVQHRAVFRTHPRRSGDRFRISVLHGLPVFQKDRFP